MRQSQRHDADVKQMTSGELRREVMRLRRKIRWHRDLRDNARCWHCDKQLYAVLPEVKPAGNMRGDPAVLLRNCRNYIHRQQCAAHGCSGAHSSKRR